MIKDLPNKLRALRVKYRYSQKQVAQKINVSPSIISGYETGERTPSAEVLLALSYVYNCSVDYLLGKQTNEPTAMFDTNAAMFDTNGLTDKQIKAIHMLIEAMKDE